MRWGYWGCNHFHKTSFEPAVCIGLMSKHVETRTVELPFFKSIFGVCDFPGHVLPVAAFVSSARDCLARFGQSEGDLSNFLARQMPFSPPKCLCRRSGPWHHLWAAGMLGSGSQSQVLLNQGCLEDSGSGAPIHWKPWWKASNPPCPWTLLAWPFSVSSKVEALGKRFVSWDNWLCTHSFSAKEGSRSLIGPYSVAEDGALKMTGFSNKSWRRASWGQMRPGLQKWSYEFPFEFARPGFFGFENRRIQIRLVGDGSKPYPPVVHMKIAGIYGCSSPKNGMYRYWSIAILM